MDSREIARLLRQRFPSEVREIVEFHGQVSVIVRKDRVRDILAFLRDGPSLLCDHLQDLCGVDYLEKKEPRFEVVYQLYSMSRGHSIRLRAQVPADDCAIDSVADLWGVANWLERECYDLMGIVFTGHPDLRRILLPADWEGHPLRKDYPLRGPAKKWKGFEEVLEKAKDLKKYEVRGLQ